jgi:tetratricopeptide (TPR) repeat protein
MAALGDVEEAIKLHRRAVGICREINHRWGTAFCLNSLAEAHIQRSDYKDARTELAEALNIALEIQTDPLALMVITTYARLLVEDDEPERAVELLAFTLAHPLIEPDTREQAERHLTQLRSTLDKTALETAHSRGAGHTMDEIAEALNA